MLSALEIKTRKTGGGIEIRAQELLLGLYYRKYNFVHPMRRKKSLFDALIFIILFFIFGRLTNRERRDIKWDA